MFKEQYNRLYSQISPDETLVEAVINEAKKHERSDSNKTRSLRKPIIAFVAICLCLSLATPVLAATVEPIYQLMYLVSPTLAQFFMPVQKSDEDNGIKMEVVSARIYENIAEVYITMQDLTGDRIDETTDLFDSYDINRPFDSAAYCKRVGYDKNTRTATFLISVHEWGSQNITGDKITFTVREFLSHKKIYEDVSVPIDLSAVEIAESTQLVSSTGGGGIDYEKYVSLDTDPIALTPTKPIDAFMVDGIDLTGIGYIDGRLHIQTAVQDNLDKDNHGFFYLKDHNGDKVDYNFNFYFLNQHEQTGQISYCNYVFTIPQSEIGNYTLHGDFVTSGMNTKGDWRVTFPLEKLL